MYTLMRVNKDTLSRSLILDLHDFENNHTVEMKYSINEYYHIIDKQIENILYSMAEKSIKLDIASWNDFIKQMIKNK